MAKTKKKEEEALAAVPPPEEDAALAIPQEEMDEMFGESELDTTGLSFNVIKILRESGQFEVGTKQFENTLTGHILFKHRAAQWWAVPFEERGPDDDPRPGCYSIDGIKPCGGEQMQAETCAACKFDKFGSSPRDGSKSKACRNTMRLLFLQDDTVIPVVLSAPPTSLSNKGPLQYWLNAVPNDVAAAYNAIGQKTKKQTPIVDYWWAHVELSLEIKKFTGDMEAAILVVKTLDVITPKSDIAQVRQVYAMRTGAKELYQAQQLAWLESETAEPEPEADGPGSAADGSDYLPDDQAI